MVLNPEKIKYLCKENGLSLKDLLAKSGVSKTAYYYLLYKDSLLPKSVHALASVLKVPPSDFLDDFNNEERKIIQIDRQTTEIMKMNPQLDRDNVRLTLLLMEEEPIERLTRGLIRGRNQINIR
jgi:transcriptional regulator with XRE-family HTH domain